MVKPGLNLSLESVRGVIVMDSEGHRILAKYFTPHSHMGAGIPKDPVAFEKNLFEKTRKTSSEVILFENYVVVYKSIVDLFIYFIAGMDENEIMIGAALNGYADALSMLFKSQVEKRCFMDHLDLALLALDETIDEGIILETDPSAISSRVTSRKASDLDSVPIGEQTLAQAWKSAQEQLTRSFLK